MFIPYSPADPGVESQFVYYCDQMNSIDRAASAEFDWSASDQYKREVGLTSHPLFVHY